MTDAAKPNLRGITPRMVEACAALAGAPEGGWTPAAFAIHFWGYEKKWARGNGTYGLGPDASGRHGGRMLTRLHDAGLARILWHDSYLYYTAVLSPAGRSLVMEQADAR